MPFQLVRGRLHALNYSPDGDTIRFEPDDEDQLGLLEGDAPAELNRRGHVSLRLEGIDALETHFEGRHQPLDLAQGARERLLALAGITGVTWDRRESTIVAAEDGTPGYILSRSTDKFGRVVAFLFAGESDLEEGRDPGPEVFLDAALMARSINAKLLAEGLAYPTYYWSLFADLRDALTEVTDRARAAGAGVWARDRTNQLFAVPSMAALTDELVIMPKLFRRASVYLAGAGGIAGFKDALEESAEPVFDLRSRNFTHFDTFVEEDEGRIRLTRQPEELVFDPMPARPGGDFASLVNGTI